MNLPLANPAAILLLGPTGSGKTPLGELIEAEGLGGRKCFHFDFGSRLRRYAETPTGALTPAELAVVVEALRSGALLTDEQFPIAGKLVAAFIGDNNIDSNDFIIMNGLPRHAGQAAALEGTVSIIAVVVLDCAAETVMARIRSDAGGDRGGRIDDTTEALARRLETFAEKTLPLTEYYERRGVPVIHVAVGPCDSAAETRDALAGAFVN